jgi:KDO2-lipid IV(A) lauroyltransferase
MRDAARKVKRGRRRGRRGEVLPGDRFEYAALRLLALLLRALPLEAGSALMGRVWRLFGPLTARHQRALGNLALAFPDLQETERRRIAAQQWENLGRTFAESLVIDRIVADPRRVELSISEALEAKLRAEGGHVIVSMHSANWEIAAFPGRRYRSMAGLYQKLANPLSDAFVARLRAHVFDGGLFVKGRQTPARIMQWVRDGNAVAMLADHRETRGIPVTVFGQPTLANPFPAMVARRLGALLVAGRAVRLPGCRFRVEAVEVPLGATGDIQDDVKAATQAIQDRFEAWIRDRPGEWMWVQDRWRINREAVSNSRRR